MARTAIAGQAAPGCTGAGVTGLILTQTAADTGNNNSTPSTGKELLVAYNSDGANTYTVTVTSVADPLGRTGDISAFSIAHGKIAIFGPFQQTGWRQPDGNLYYQANNAAILFSPIILP
jgi:hypothetical protein